MSPSPEIVGLLEVDRMVHSPPRAAILTLLSVVSAGDFVWLQQQTGLTAGNISSHMSRLEAHGLVSISKHFQDRKPKTRYQITPAGLEALQTWQRTLSALLTAST